MQLHGIEARGKRKVKVTTESNYGLPVAPDLLNRQCTVHAPNPVWASDITYITYITYIATDAGWLSLAQIVRNGCGV